jgi:Concanavalin A-like lectin/glucanases superfamily
VIDWFALLIPFAAAALVVALVFVGCGLDVEGTWVALSYHDTLQAGHHLMAYWRLGESTGDAVDEVNNHNGKYLGSGVTRGVPGLIDGDQDKAASFDGANGYVEVPFNPDLNPAPYFSVEAWVKLTGRHNTFRSIVTSRDVAGGKRFGFMLYAGDNEHWQAWVGAGNAWRSVLGETVRYNERQHVMMTYDGTLRLYVDYIDNTTDTKFKLVTPYLPNASKPLRIGAGATELATPQFYFPGVIDEVSVHDFPYDKNEVAMHYGSNHP